MDLPDNSELFNDLSFDRISAKEIYKIMEKYKNDPKRIRIGKKDIRSVFEVKNNPNNTNEKEVYYYSSRYLSLQDATYELYHYFLGTNYLGSFWYVITDQIIQTIIIAECIRKVYRRKKYEK